MTGLTIVLGLLVALLAISTALLALYVVRVRSRRHQDGFLRKWPIRKVSLEQFDPRFRAGPLGPDLATEVAFVSAYRVPAGVSDRETWILATLAKGAKRIFEFGTASGKTAYVLARNAPADAEVATLTLPPDGASLYRGGADDDPDSERAALEESRFDRFYYDGTAVESKVKQLFGDSKAFDEAPYRASCDLVFVDGAHAYSYVKSDSEKALAMVKPGGAVLWHDYHGPRRAKGVYRALNELAREIPLVRIAGTALVAYRAPDSSETD